MEPRIPKLHTRLAEASFNEQQKRGVPLAKTLEDSDPFVVLLAMREMGSLWKPEYFKTLVELMARDDAQLVRFDALSALAIEGGPEGRELALEHAAHEQHPRLKKLLQTLEEDGAFR